MYNYIARVFVSHAWKYNHDYDTIISWLRSSNLVYRNYSVPEHNPVDANNDTKLKKRIN